MPNFPHEIIVEILSRLPIKSLFRFKCVSKPWRILISDPHFITINLNQTQKLRLILASKSLYSVDLKPFFNANGDIEAIEIDCPMKSNSKTDFIQIFGSCNGLVCIMPEPNIFFIFNPCTREFKKIPDSSLVTNACFPSIPPPDIYGFGYAPSLDDYKFIKVAFGAVLAVYSLRSNSWNRMVQYFPYHATPYAAGAPLNGVIHWVVHRRGDASTKCVIAAFDMVEETFKDLPVPDNVYDSRRFIVCVMNDCLCLFHHYDSKSNEFWVMREYGVMESWTKIVINVPYYTMKPMGLMEDGKAMLAIDQERFVVCNLENGMCEDVSVSAMPALFESDVYVESLVSPNLGNGA